MFINKAQLQSVGPAGELCNKMAKRGFVELLKRTSIRHQKSVDQQRNSVLMTPNNNSKLETVNDDIGQGTGVKKIGKGKSAKKIYRVSLVDFGVKEDIKLNKQNQNSSD